MKRISGKQGWWKQVKAIGTECLKSSVRKLREANLALRQPDHC